MKSTTLTTFWLPTATIGFGPQPLLFHHRSTSTSALFAEPVGVFFGTSTGSTESAAEILAAQLGAPDPIDIDLVGAGNLAAEFAKYDALVVGTPTWNTGADTERSGTGWDEIYYTDEMQTLDLKDKHVAVFGMGDSESYAENYADATGELYDVMKARGSKVFGFTSQEGYEHEDSKAILADGQFCGLLLDNVNFEELTEPRIEAWVEKLKSEGFMEAGGAAPEVVAAAPAVEAAAEQPVGVFFGTSTGSTESAAEILAAQLGAPDPIDIDLVGAGNLAAEFAKYDALVVGTPTWNTGADTERSGTGWDEIYYTDEMQTLNLKDKHVAVFGMGDSESYAENYADATGELYDVMVSRGCKVFGFTSQEGYEHEDSKAILADGQFCGLLLDNVNFEELTEPRIEAWVEKLKSEGFMEAGGAAAPEPVVVAAAPAVEAAEQPVGVFFGTSTGSTESAAEILAAQLGAPDPIDIDLVGAGNLAAEFAKYDALVVGTPTWNTGADTERSGTGWDEIYYTDEMQTLNLKDKHVAVFGMGDSESYAENYADATGELYDVMVSRGCKVFGFTSQEGYEHEDSKAILADGQFCGLLLDNVNFEELTEPRIEAWVEKLKDEGFMEAGGAATSAAPVAAVAAPDPVVVAAVEEDDAMRAIIAQLEAENAALKQQLKDDDTLLTNSDGFEPHFNSRTGRTMWTSPDGRTCYYTTTQTKMSP